MTLKELYEKIDGNYEQAVNVLRVEKLIDKHVRRICESEVVTKLINAREDLDPTALFEKSKSKISEEKLLKNLLFNYSSIIHHNHDLIENKVKKANGGFKFLKLAGIVSVLFIVYILVLMVHFN